MSNPAKTIDQVIDVLQSIINECKLQQSTLGYFAALYQKVTIKVKEGIANGTFEDGPRMEKLDVIFANRYIDAYNAYRSSGNVTCSWTAAFNLSKMKGPIVLQHLLIGMNAHINLDLGIAAYEVMNGKDLDLLENDFNKINEILSSLVHDVERSLSDIWPTLKWILAITGKVDDFLIDFSMKVARDGAWKFAKQLEGSTSIKTEIDIRDKKIFDIGKLVTNPGLIPKLIFLIIRLGERGNVTQRISEIIDPDNVF